MEIVIFKIINIMDINKVLDLIKLSNKKRFASKGDSVVEVNKKVVDIAHLVSEIKPIKHYWDTGIAARKGIEY